MAKAAPLFALLAGLGALVGLAGANLGILAPLTGFMIFVGSALLGGAVTVLLSLIAVFLGRGGRNPDGQKLALAGLAVGVGLLLIVAVAASPGSDLPPINDITTSLQHPPAFASAEDVPAYAGRDMSYPEEFKTQVYKAYPDLTTQTYSLSKEAAYLKAVMIAKDMGWVIVHEDPEAGTFDAFERTKLFRFVDDITVHVKANGPGSRIDLRSKSRDGRGDLGANAARIRKFYKEMEL